MNQTIEVCCLSLSRGFLDLTDLLSQTVTVHYWCNLFRSSYRCLNFIRVVNQLLWVLPNTCPFSIITINELCPTSLRIVAFLSQSSVSSILHKILFLQIIPWFSHSFFFLSVLLFHPFGWLSVLLSLYIATLGSGAQLVIHQQHSREGLFLQRCSPTA